MYDSKKHFENVTVRKEVDVVITIQAQRILASSKYSVKDFENWALQDQKISLGGNNVALFLESMCMMEGKE